jgi:stage II sporulation protein D
MPKEVIVDLFQAQPATRQILIDGACRLLLPENRRLPGSNFVVRSCGQGMVEICISAQQGSRRRDTACGASLARSRSIVLRGIGGVTRIVHSSGVRRSYRGEITFAAGRTAGTLRISNRVPVRDYVTAVVGSETNPDFPGQQLQAQAVLVQTMLARYKPGDPLGDTTEKEAYLGADYERTPVRQAVDAVWQQMLVFDGQPIQIYFHSTCAGGTSDGAEYFDLKPAHAYPYLQGRPCDFCLRSPFWQEKRALIPRTVYNRNFGDEVPTVLSWDSRKRPLAIKRSSRAQPEHAFSYWSDVGRKLGWDKVPGTRFSLARDAVTGDMIFRSTGAGHGVGLCQWGASEMARRGKTYKQILAYYFPGATVQASK